MSDRPADVTFEFLFFYFLLILLKRFRNASKRNEAVAKTPLYSTWATVQEKHARRTKRRAAEQTKHTKQALRENRPNRTISPARKYRSASEDISDGTTDRSTDKPSDQTID